MGQNIWLIVGGGASIALSLYLVNRFDLSRTPPMQALTSNTGKRLPMLAVVVLVMLGGALIYIGLRAA